ncbi:MAG: Ig-like domain-containing protein [Lachnospiraceae bacterium]
MRLRKRVISALLAACMAVTVFPSGMPLKAAEVTEETTKTAAPEKSREEIEMPEVQAAAPEGEGEQPEPEVLPEESKEEEKVLEDAGEGQPEDNKDGTLALAEEDSAETENDINIYNVDISDTYYSINGKFPMYVEYQASWGEAGVERDNLKLVVKDENSKVVAEAESDSNKNYFYVPECKDIRNGDCLELDFDIIYTKGEIKKTFKTYTRSVSFKDMDFRINKDYFPVTGIAYSVNVSFLNVDSDNNDIYGMYLFDEDNKIAAGTREKISDMYGSDSRYGNTFSLSNPDSLNGMKWSYKNISFYRTRKLKAKEKLYLGLRYKEGEEIKTDKTEMVYVTDQPYIESVSSDTMDLYIEAGNTSFIEVHGYNNIDFSKVSVELKDEKTKELAGRSISSIKRNNNYAYYCIKWEDGKKPGNSGSYTYNINFHYSDNEINLISKIDSVNYYNYRNDEAIWNYRADTIEYYNTEIPANSLVSYKLMDDDEYTASASICASGAGIRVSDKHLLTIDIKDKMLNNYSYYLYVTYKDNNGKETKVNTIVYNRQQDGEKELPWLYSYGLENSYYLSNDTSMDFSAWVYCNDESKLLNECSAKITDYNDSAEIDTIKLSLEKKDNNLFYKGTYNKSLNTGRYHLLFSPDGKTELGYTFYVYNINILPIFYQGNSISSGIISMHIPSSMVAEWYCGENNSKIKEKLTVKILDIEKKEIGTYTAANSDFNIIYDTNSRDMTIQFSESIKQSFSDLYYCYVYLYYNGIEVHSYYNPVESLYDYSKSYREYIRGDEATGSVYMAEIRDDGSMSYGYSGFNFYDNYNFNGVYGTESSFPVKVTVADWYSAEPLKTITVQKPKDVFTKAQLEGLSSDKVYNFFLEGADGTADVARGYLYAESYEGDKPSSPKPTSGTDSGSGSIAPYVPPVSNGGNDIQPTTAPTVQPEATTAPTAAPTANPTTVPTSAPTTQPTAVPEATAAPAATAPPAEVKEPETPVINNPYVPSQEEKPVLKLKKNKITLKKGQKAKIKITSKLTTSVTYKSLKPSVATVSKKGVVTAKKAGKAVITVKANEVVKKVQVTVKKAGKTEEGTESTIKTASSVKLGKDFKLAKQSITLKKGQKLTIKKASGLSGKVTFKSLDKKIASVSVNGVVKAKKKGKTTILIKKGKKTIKLKVIVKK